jgi:uncharacterized membrane protein
MHSLITWVHIAAGMFALVAGGLAAGARKGGPLHARAGTWFFASMMALGVTAAILEPFRTPTPGSPINGVFVVYFVLTSWVAARRRDGATGKFEIAACAVALALAAAIAWDAIAGNSTTPVGRGPLLVFAGIFLLAGLGDLNAVLRRKLSAAQRLSRHLWRMCVAFFIATGSFFLGQQDIMPAAVRGSPLLFVLAFAPFALMLFWLVRIRFSKALRAINDRLQRTLGPAAAPQGS